MDRKNDTLFFIPDISGFTDFVNETEITHSSHIISELLGAIMSKNKLKLELVEVEGDALFYFKKGNLPKVTDILDQVKEMFLHFQYQLLLYKHQRLCNCGACSSAINLGLKFIIHAGDSEMVSISGGASKPFGKDVILAHKFLKNEYEGHQYVLMTDSLTEEPKPDWFNQLDRVQQAYHSSNISISDLSALLSEMPSLPSVPTYTKTANPIAFEANIEVPIGWLYELISNLNKQMTWKKGVEKLEYNEDHVNRVGEKHLCYIDGKVLEIETVSADFGKDSQVFGEKTTDIPLLKSITTYFIMTPNSNKSTNLRIEAHLESKSFISRLMSPFVKKMIKKIIKDNLESIKAIAIRELPAAA